MSTLVKQENGKKVSNIEVSVDACAELGGQVYVVICALRDVYRLSGLRNLTYVDTFQGVREKSDGTTPETLFAFGNPYSNFGRFLYHNQSWRRLVETLECKKFSHILGHDILPSMTAPIIDAVEVICSIVQKEVFGELKKLKQDKLSKRTVKKAADVEIAIRAQKTGDQAYEKLKLVEPLVKKALSNAMEYWSEIVDANPVLSQSRSNKTKDMCIKLIAYTQECKAIAASLLFHYNPKQARRMGKIPPLVTRSIGIPPLSALRDFAHQFGHLHFPKHSKIWLQPEVQQAVRYTGIWPWARKPYMRETAHEILNRAHRDTADRAAISYFLNDLSHRKNIADTLYVLVTHDGPLIADFIKFITGVERKEVAIKDSRMKGVGRQKKTQFIPVSPREYVHRELMPVALEKQPYSAILTGAEFLTFVKREQERVLKKAPMTHELNQANKTLADAVKLLEDVVKQDKQKYGLTKGGTFAERVRVNAAAGIRNS